MGLIFIAYAFHIRQFCRHQIDTDQSGKKSVLYYQLSNSERVDNPMKHFLIFTCLVLLGTMNGNLVNAQSRESVGGDTYIHGAASTLSTNAPRDVFASGFSVSLDGNISGDAHVAGFNVGVDGDVGSDLYAAGFNISVDSTIAEDVSASGFTIDINDSASIGGNARLAGGTVTIDAPVSGSLVAAAGIMKLDAVIEGDVRLIARNVTFGSNAKILGKLVYSTPNEIDIPETVITSAQVEYKPLTGRSVASQVSKQLEDTVSGFWPSVFSVIIFFTIMLAFLLIVAAIFISFMGERVERLRLRATHHYGISILFGFLGLATLFGLVPVSATTLVGLPFVPIVILLIIAMWTVGYLLGVYTLSWRIASAFRELSEDLMTRMVVIAIGIISIAILNFIPVVGSLLNFLLVLLGLGSIVISVITSLMTMEIFSSIPDNEIAGSPKKKA